MPRDMVVCEGMVLVAETAGAYGCKQLVDGAFLTGTPKDNVDFWIPRSQVQEDPTWDGFGTVCELIIPRWLAEKKDALEFEAY